MFNDLNNPNNQGRPAVDDIFAETDKPQESGAPGAGNASGASGAEIETRQVGLTAADETMEEPTEKRRGSKWFKIILILIVAAILILGGYLVYSKFFNSGAEMNLNAPPPASDKTTSTPAPAEEIGSFVPTTTEEGTSVDTSVSATEITDIQETPEIPGVNAPAASIEATTTLTDDALVSLIDSDSDGLTDTEEKTAGTNINVIDTDNDGLSDYEEVKIYLTDPLNADTDADGYLDGAEVNSGYNPKGAGKLLKENVTTP